ncbi:MAG: peptidoglycan/xylan/chitin deacetylase (PgdA/CDA1 family) [Bacteroidia bacterium]|jgi:peptidoglycan/xylan/chitin deacetylase (PgdA/CDA1 family)
MKQAAIRLTSALLPRIINPRGGGRLSILIYHRVMPDRDPMRPDEPTVAEFELQMEWVRRYFQPLPLLEAVERLAQGTLPPRAVCVTFDDGYSDNETLALPVLQRYDIPATVFVSTGFLNGGRMWNDTVIESLRNCESEVLDLSHFELGRHELNSSEARRDVAQRILSQIKHQDPAQRVAIVQDIASHAASLPDALMMTDDQVRSLAQAGISIGAHTVTHPILGSIDMPAARQEISQSKDSLEELLQRDIELFAYPNGRPGLDYEDKHRDLVESLGFKAAVSTHLGVGVRDSDPYQLPRFTPWDKEEFRYMLRLLLNQRMVDPLVAA